jgi:hypothetical protein
MIDQMEFTKVTNSLAPELAKTYVILWDIGPTKPVPPIKPPLPKGKEGEPEFDLAMIEFKEHLEEYADGLKAYGRAKQEYAKWSKDQGGAIELRFFSCDAHDALARDPARYHISASTRGYEKLKNHGLPPGHKPGRGHQENLRRAEEGEAEFAAALARDPVFGNPELRP